MNRMKLAELTSGVGALVLGAGMGALFPRWFAPAAGLIATAGLFLHAFGMWDKHRMERQEGARDPAWVAGLYWACWLLLGIVLVIVLFKGG